MLVMVARSHAARRLVAAGAAVLLLLLLTVVLFVATLMGGLVRQTECGVGNYTPSAAALAEIPGNYLRWIQAAGARYGLDWTVHPPVGRRRRERHWMPADAPHEHGEVPQHALARAAVGAPADEADRALGRAEQIATPGIERDRLGAAEDDRSDVVGMARGVDRHEQSAPGLPPEVQLVDSERRAHGIEVVGDRGRAVVAGLRADVGAARLGDALQVDRGQVLGRE